MALDFTANPMRRRVERIVMGRGLNREMSHLTCHVTYVIMASPSGKQENEMEYPMQLETIDHKSGGKITRVTGFEHVIDKPREGRSTDTWHFRGDVKWGDGGESLGLEIGPHALCCDDPPNNPELTALYAAMNEHLTEHGEWSDNPKHEGWYAHERR